MRFLIFSDSHGQNTHIKKTLLLHPEADAIIFLGDGVESFKSSVKDVTKVIYTVKGNCDIGSNEREIDFICYNNHKIMICHGHKYNVKYGIDLLLSVAKSNECDVVLFGHTHIPFNKYIDGVYILNPGSICVSPTPTYAILDINDNGIITNTVTAQ